ncbi:MAG: leucine-rich repeat protein [Paludibacteraceae bacterium]|nr:leucine-rich repeat protein [Paludibacteraceae bacterium]
MSNIDYTLWPNADRNLGEIKVQIPDGVTTTWPEGDALVGNFVYKNGLLSGFVDTKALIVNESKSTTFPYDYVNIQVDKSLEGIMTFNQGERTKNFTVSYVESGSSGDTIVLGTKYLGCKTIFDVITVDPNYATTDIVDGIWTQSLADFEGSYIGPGESQFSFNHNLIDFHSDLSSLKIGNFLFHECSNLTTFNADLSSLTSALGMFSGSNLQSFTSNLDSLVNGEIMFSGCSNLSDFKIDLSSLENGYGMFEGCSLNTNSLRHISSTIKNVNGIITSTSFGGTTGKPILTLGISNEVPSEEEKELFTNMMSKGWRVFLNNDLFYIVGEKYKGCITPNDVKNTDPNYISNDIKDGVWEENLFDLKYGNYDEMNPSYHNGLFYDCDTLTSFNADLSSLSNGYEMFASCSNLRNFNSSLNSLTEGRGMFRECSNLTAFNSDLSSLTRGGYMFQNCAALTAFTSDLSSLTSADSMFQGCSLDTASIKNIAETINTVTDDPSIYIGIGNSIPSEEEHTYLTQIYNKGWRVYVNGWNSYVPATASLDETGETQTAPIPFWAKPEPATEDEAKYIDENGNFFNIIGGQFIYVSDPDTYGMFTSLEDAAANMRLTPYTKPQNQTNNN